jgi:hypothetical protein
MAKESYTINGSTYSGDRIRERVRAYNHSKKGKEKRQLWLKRNQQKIKIWHHNHFQQKRKWARENKYCTTCFKNKTEEGFKTCNKCLERQRGNKNESKA